MKNLIKYLTIINLLFTINSFGGIYKVDDYGAVGDGITDDRTAIMNAINDLKSNGGEVQFTSGKEYLLSLGLNIYDFTESKQYKLTTTSEEKATIKIEDGAPLTWKHWIFCIDNSRNVEINNLILDGNRDTRNPTVETSGTDCICVLDNCNGLSLRNVKLMNSPADNLYITVRNSSDTTTFLTDFEMYNCVLENAWRNNMSVIRGKNFKIIGCEFNNAHGYAPEGGIDFEPNSGGDDLGTQNMLIEGCIFRNNHQYGLYFNDIETESGYSTVKNCIFDNNALFIASEYNVAKNNIFMNLDHMPTFSPDNDPRDGIIYFHVNNESNYNKVYNNYFYNNPTPSDMHIINFMGNAGSNNEAYDNFAYNTTVTGFVYNPTGQTVYGNIFLKNIEMGYWNMDRDSISGASIFDLSDFKQTGVIHGEPTIVNGQYNQALDFSPDNKYIEIPITEHLQIEANMTISAWIKWEGTNSEPEQVIVGKDTDWRFGIDNTGEITFYAPKPKDDSYSGGLLTSDIAVAQNKWTHVAVSYNGRFTKLYIDGEESGEKNTIGNLPTNFQKIYIASQSGEEKSFNGAIDDVKLFNYPLSAAEIDSLSNILSDRNQTMPKGMGTTDDPYQIRSLVHLSWLAQNPEQWSVQYIQTSDIDASATKYWDDSDDNGDGDRYNDENDYTSAGENNGWSPLGTDARKFDGNYNGNGYEINYLSIKNRESGSNGFFGIISGGTVRNLGLTKIDISGSKNVGGLTGICGGNIISKCYTTGVITGIDGGITSNDFGGLVGLAGEGASTNIDSCYSDVKIMGDGANNQKAGGIVGSLSNMSVIMESYSLGNIENIGEKSGGFVGSLQNSTISNCYSFGSVKRATGSSAAIYGGFVGVVSEVSIIEDSYSIGAIDNALFGKGFVGSETGDNVTFSSNFFDMELSGQGSSVGAEGKTSVAMMDSTTFYNAGWDMNSIWQAHSNYPNLRHNSNTFLEKGGIPGEIPGIKGDGGEDNPYQIARLSDLALVAQNSSTWGAYFVQTSDIDASQTSTWDDSDDNSDGNKYNDANDLTMEGNNEGFSSLGNNTIAFSGVYDGSGYKIDKLHINRSSTKYVGLFGKIAGVSDESPAVIKDLQISHVSITGEGNIGGMAGYNFNSNISKCAVSGSIMSSSSTGYVGGFVGYNVGQYCELSQSSSNVIIESNGSGSYIGGFVGRNRGDAVISRCYSEGSVTGAGGKIGGFAGQVNGSSVDNCYSTVMVSGTGTSTSIGGFCGSTYNGTIEYCYSIGENTTYNTKGFLGTEGGTENRYTSNYLDTEASACDQSALPIAAEGKTTSEMKNQSTYVGWDFTNVWSIESGNYPKLTGVVSDIAQTEKVIPPEFSLEQNYPNPFNPTTSIDFTISVEGITKLEVYNTLGQKVKTLLNEKMHVGSYSVPFDGSRLSSGIYFYKLQSKNVIKIKKMILLK